MAHFSLERQKILWLAIESLYNEKDIVPIHVKNLLSIQGFDSLLAMKTINEQNLKEIEQFAGTMLPQLASNDPLINLGDFLHIYASMPKSFKFMEGTRNTLLEIARTLQSKLQQKRMQLADGPESSLHDPIRKPPRKRLYPEYKQNEHLGGEANERRRDRLIKNANMWIEKSYYNTNLNSRFLVTTAQIVRDDGISVFGVIYCPICDFPSRVQLMFNEQRTTEKWVIGNFGRHFKVHFRNAKQNQLPKSRKSEADDVSEEEDEVKYSAELYPSDFDADPLDA